MAEETISRVQVDPPRGFHQASVDDKGRLKLPAAIQKYLAALPDKKFFVTTLGAGIIRIYPDSVWRFNDKFFEEFKDDPEQAEKVAFMANAFGGDAEIDGQGRVLLPPGLRRKHAVGGTVQLHFFKARIDVYPQSLYDELTTRLEADLEPAVKALERMGLR